MKKFNKKLVAFFAGTTVALGAVVAVAPTVSANPVSGAIFTTTSDGSEVNFNIYPSKEAVYLNGGPGAHANAAAAGLPDGTYVFQVTDPSGKTLLSTDLAACRQVTVVSGVFSSVAPSGACAHMLGTSPDGGISVQLMPYDDTPNNGGEYKAWVTPVADFLANCSALNVPAGLTVRDCGRVAGNEHGFVGADSKTDNFKVKSKSTVEIDTTFHDSSGRVIDGLAVTWFDTHGSANTKWSYFAPSIFVNHQAHVEAPEVGTHHIVIADQAGCVINGINVNGAYHGASGSQDVSVSIKTGSKSTYITVYCA